MTEVDGVQTELSPEEVQEAQANNQPEGAAEPEKPAGEQPPEEQQPKEAPAKPEAEPTKDQQPQEPEKPAPEAEPEKEKKARPIATLLQKKHDAEAALETERESWAKKEADYQAKIQELSKQPDSAATDDDIKKFAEEINADEGLVARLIALARKGIPQQVPDEVKTFIEKQKQNEAIQAEAAAFDNRFSRLAKVMPEIAAHKNKIEELAYSDEVAPDGEKYSEKELSEIYLQFVKPEVEPGKPSGEGSQRRGPDHNQVIDFQAMKDRDDPKEFQEMIENDPEFLDKYHKWEEEQGGNGAIVQRYL